jgi:hypothetical protein
MTDESGAVGAIAPAKRKRPDDAEETQPHNPDVVERSRETETPAPIDIAEEIKDRVRP